VAGSKLGRGWEVRNDLPAKGEFFLDIPSFIERDVRRDRKFIMEVFQILPD